MRVNGFEREPFPVISSVLHVVMEKYDVSLLSRYLQHPYHCFYINRLESDFLSPGNIQRIQSER